MDGGGRVDLLLHSSLVGHHRVRQGLVLGRQVADRGLQLLHVLRILRGLLCRGRGCSGSRSDLRLSIGHALLCLRYLSVTRGELRLQVVDLHLLSGHLLAQFRELTGGRADGRLAFHPAGHSVPAVNGFLRRRLRSAGAGNKQRCDQRCQISAVLFHCSSKRDNKELHTKDIVP